MRIGPIIMIVSPVEATTMAGRRWRNAISDATIKMNLLSDMSRSSPPEPIVLLGYGIQTPDRVSKLTPTIVDRRIHMVTMPLQKKNTTYNATREHPHCSVHTPWAPSYILPRHP